MQTNNTDPLAKAVFSLDSALEGLKTLDADMQRHRQQQAERLLAASRLYGIAIEVDQALPAYGTSIHVGAALWEVLRDSDRCGEADETPKEAQP